MITFIRGIFFVFGLLAFVPAFAHQDCMPAPIILSNPPRYQGGSPCINPQPTQRVVIVTGAHGVHIPSGHDQVVVHPNQNQRIASRGSSTSKCALVGTVIGLAIGSQAANHTTAATALGGLGGYVLGDAFCDETKDEAKAARQVRNNPETVTVHPQRCNIHGVESLQGLDVSKERCKKIAEEVAKTKNVEVAGNQHPQQSNAPKAFCRIALTQKDAEAKQWTHVPNPEKAESYCDNVKRVLNGTPSKDRPAKLLEYMSVSH